MKKVGSFKELKKLTFDEPKMEITLLDRNLMTRKVIQYDGNGEFFFDDYSTGFRDEISEKELIENTAILKAIEDGKLNIED